MRRLDGARLGEHLQRLVQLMHGRVVVLVRLGLGVGVGLGLGLGSGSELAFRVRVRVRAAVSWSWNCSALEAEEHSRCASTTATRSGLKEGPRVGCSGAVAKPGGMAMCCAGGGGG